MAYLGIIGPWQIILILGLPIALFVIGYQFGKKAGYIKRIKETEAKQNQ
jgi:hypothetical protein